MAIKLARKYLFDIIITLVDCFFKTASIKHQMLSNSKDDFDRVNKRVIVEDCHNATAWYISPIVVTGLQVSFPDNCQKILITRD